MIIEYINLEEARKCLGISKGKMAKLVKQGILKIVPDTLSLGIQMIKKEDVQNLKSRDMCEQIYLGPVPKAKGQLSTRSLNDENGATKK